MEITVVNEQSKSGAPVTVLQVVGKIDSGNAEMLQQKADEAIDGGARHLIFDLGGVPYTSSAGLRAFQDVFNKLRALSSDGNDKDTSRKVAEGSYQFPYLKLVSPTKEVLEVLKMSGFDMLVSIEKDLKKALASM